MHVSEGNEYTQQINKYRKMTGKEEDILVDIPDEDLAELSKMYEKHKDWAPHAYSTITTGIEWRQKSDKKYMTFMSPKACWKEDGTFFVLVEYHCYDIFVFSLDESGKNVYNALINTKRLDTDYSDRPRLFFSVHYKLYPVIIKAIQEKKMKIDLEVPCYMYSISAREAIKFNTECPPEVYIKKLDKADARTINEIWPHKYRNSEKYISLLVDLNDSYGVYLKSNQELVSWIIVSILGQLQALQTKDEYKKKGYGSLITRYVSKELAKKGHNPFGTILVENIASLKMFEKYGFKSLGVCTYIQFH